MTKTYEERQKIDAQRQELVETIRGHRFFKMRDSRYNPMVDVVKTLAWTDWTQQDRTKFANAFRDMCIADSYHSASNLIKAVTESATKMELGPARKAFNYMALVLEQKLTDEISRERSAVADSGRTPFTEYMGRETMSPAEREVARYHGRALD